MPKPPAKRSQPPTGPDPDALAGIPARHDGVEWSNTGVRLSVPSGTDPLAALREAMGVFMERRDGTNAMPWWLRVRWWHGGEVGLDRIGMLLPPSETGYVPQLDFTDRYSCYITTDRDEAIMFAARFAHPGLYEVALFEEPLLDDTVESTTSFRCRRARIWRRESISREDLLRVRARLTARMRAHSEDERACVEIPCPPLEEYEINQEALDKLRADGSIVVDPDIIDT